MDSEDLRADILEIFSSIQGEGPFTGIRQIFVKFANCNLNCRFCDFERDRPSKEFSIDKLTSIVKQIRQNSGSHHSVSLTGGEPLLYKEYLKVLLPKIKEIGLKTYLETNGTLPESLREVIDLVDIVALDFKLPSSTDQRDYWEEHAEFLKIAKEKNCFVKAVITSQTKEADITRAIEVIYEVDKDILLVLQPAWPVKGVERPKSRLLFDYLFLAEKRLNNARIMPQMHKYIGVR